MKDCITKVHQVLTNLLPDNSGIRRMKAVLGGDLEFLGETTLFRSHEFEIEFKKGRFALNTTFSNQEITDEWIKLATTLKLITDAGNRLLAIKEKEYKRCSNCGNRYKEDICSLPNNGTGFLEALSCERWGEIK